MDVIFRKVRERDIDLLLLEQMCCSVEFVNWFFFQVTKRHPATLLDDKANIWAFAWVYKISRQDFTIDAEVLPRLVAAYRSRPYRVPLDVRRRADEIIHDVGPEVYRMLRERETWAQVEKVAKLLLKNETVTPDMLQ
jgi:hypothetical protein